MTLAATILFSVLFRGFLGRISIFLGVIVGYIVAASTGQVDFSGMSDAAWIGLPAVPPRRTLRPRGVGSRADVPPCGAGADR